MIEFNDSLFDNCSSAFKKLNWKDSSVVISLVLLGLLCLLVILGNLLVILSVRMTSKLRNPTHYFIVSLAVADLSLGILILPFSAIYEVFQIWIFGRLWCTIWLAGDVWMCTSSILHLVIISLDRYIAVTHSVRYPLLMTSLKAKGLICGAWILSFIICFPPLVGWNDNAEPSYINSQYFNASERQLYSELYGECYLQCKLILEPGYVIYSAVGSFYAPMLIMIFLNWKIYQTAKKTTRAIRQGWVKVGQFGMGIHRGGTQVTSSVSKTKPFSSKIKTSLIEEEKEKSNSLSVPNSNNTIFSNSSHECSRCFKWSVGSKNEESFHHSSSSSPSSSCTSQLLTKWKRKKRIKKRKKLTCALMKKRSTRSTLDADLECSPTIFRSKINKEPFKSLGKRNMKSQVRRFRMETKAAKTLGIIVGVFISCWFPFFTMYLTTAFCKDCIPQIVFSVIFWLGYCNSAINPFIYAMFLNEFRQAFQRILNQLFFCFSNSNKSDRDEGLTAMGFIPYAPKHLELSLDDNSSQH